MVGASSSKLVAFVAVPPKSPEKYGAVIVAPEVSVPLMESGAFATCVKVENVRLETNAVLVVSVDSFVVPPKVEAVMREEA